MKKDYNNLLIVVGVLLVIVVGFSFAYFIVSTNVQGTGTPVASESERLLQVTFDAGSSKLVGTNLFPKDMVSKTFKVNVTPGSVTNNAIYAISLNITENTFVKCNDDNYDEIENVCEKNAAEIIYTLKDGSGNVIATGDLTGKTGNVVLKKENKTVSTSTDFNYTLEIAFKDTGKDQNHNQEAVINADIKVAFAEQYIRGNANAVIASGELTEENGYRYQGSDPNNYVLFNGDELWRIIGVFNVTTEAGDQENLIKIIRDESIGNISWDSGGDFGENDWTTSDIKDILNGQYYNGEDINYSYRNPDNTRISNKTVTITGKSLKKDAREKVESVVWNLGGATGDFVTTEAMYNAERSDRVYSGRPTIWTGYIGLMYPSDYGYASPSSTCPRTTNLNSYDNTGCYDNNWLKQSHSQWTMTPRLAGSNSATYVLSLGDVSNIYASSDVGGRPSLYLKSSVQIIDGEGTHDVPYKLN